MASVEEKRVNGKIFSYYFSCTLGRDSQGRQIRRYKTWKVLEGLTPSKAKKLAEREAKAWEAELRAEFEAKTIPEAQVQEKEIIPINFADYVKEVWLPKQGIITENPMLKVDSPKLERKKVEALTPEEARLFIEALIDCPLEFRCLLLLLITTGLRRGECLGLQWSDINFSRSVLKVQRNVTQISGVGIVVIVKFSVFAVCISSVVSLFICLCRNMTDKKFEYVAKTAKRLSKLSERRFARALQLYSYGEAAAEEIGVHPMLIWWR